MTEEEVLVYGGITSKRPLINFKDVDLERDRRLIEKNEELKETFVAPNGKSLCIFLRHEDYLDAERCGVLLEYMKMVSERFEFDKIRVAGRIIGQSFYIQKMSFEMILFIGISFVLVTVFLLIAFKSIWGLILPVVVLMGSMVWIIGFMGWYGEPISVVMTTLPSIMFVVAISDVIHLVSRYMDIYRNSEQKFESIRDAIKEVDW